MHRSAVSALTACALSLPPFFALDQHYTYDASCRRTTFATAYGNAETVSLVAAFPVSGEHHCYTLEAGWDFGQGMTATIPCNIYAAICRLS